jgi:hypothetical protein
MLSPVGLAILLGAAFYLFLHFFEPALAATWSYAHLGRSPLLVAAGALAVVALPPLVLAADRLPFLHRAWPRPARRTVLLAFVALAALFVVAGWFNPTSPLCIDSPWFAIQVYVGDRGNMRWYLTLATYTPLLRVVEWLSPIPVPARNFVPVVNGVVSAASYLLLLGCARQLARDRFETLAIALLAWGAFGNFQLIFYYMDIYPVVQLLMSLYVLTALRAIRGSGRLVWPILIAAIAPFFYVGLVLMVPSALVVLLAARHRGASLGELAIPCAAAVGAAGLATIPAYGLPFAFAPYLRDLARDSAAPYGYDPTSSLLPLHYVFSAPHLAELGSLLLLIDGTGVLLCLTAGVALLPRLLGRDPDWSAWLLLTVLVCLLPYFILMDAVWGAYLDWDLFSYLAIPTSLLGGHALMVWGRAHRPQRALLVGLLLAAEAVHVLARANALEVEYKRHVAETPMHLSVPSAP